MRPSVQKLRILLERICKSRRSLWQVDGEGSRSSLVARNTTLWFSITYGTSYISILGSQRSSMWFIFFFYVYLMIRQVFFDSVIQCRSCTKRQSCSGSFQVFYSSLSLLSSFILFSFLFLDILWFFLSLTLMYCTFFPIVVSFRRDTSPYMK